VTAHSRRGALPPETAEAVADAMFALSTPSRVRLLGHLRSGPCTVNELVEAVGMQQSAVSHQLRVLREHRLVVVERRGRERIYALHDEHVAAMFDDAVGHVVQLANGRERATTPLVEHRLRPA
jgi:DNA-binding transcriptional ArsR family regulator